MEMKIFQNYSDYRPKVKATSKFHTTNSCLPPSLAPDSKSVSCHRKWWFGPKIFHSSTFSFYLHCHFRIAHQSLKHLAACNHSCSLWDAVLNQGSGLPKPIPKPSFYPDLTNFVSRSSTTYPLHHYFSPN